MGYYYTPKPRNQTPPPPTPPKLSPRDKIAPSANEEKLQTGSSKKKTKGTKVPGAPGNKPEKGKYYGTGP